MDELALYDATRDELRNRLAGRFPADFELESTVTAYAYWVCAVIRNHDKDWESTVRGIPAAPFCPSITSARVQI